MSMRIVKPSTPSEKQTHTTMDTIELTQKLVASWKSPPFQRDLKVNARVIAVSAEILRNGGVVPGILTIGVLDGETYVVDGQHRLNAWQQTGLPCGYADVRTHWFDSVGDMANEFVRLNTSLVKMRPDDVLRGMESSTIALQKIHRRCPFVGYDMVRRSERSPVLSMSVVVKCWAGSRPEIPSGGGSSLEALAQMDDKETADAIEFYNLCFDAWGRDKEHARLWSKLNLIICAWLYRRVVLGQNMTSTKRWTRFTKDQFKQGLQSVAATPDYTDFLLGRNMSERDRSPAYMRVKTIIQRRYAVQQNKKALMPSPAWAGHTGS